MVHDDKAVTDLVDTAAEVESSRNFSEIGHKAVALYIVSSLLYYKFSCTIMSDATFDALCQYLLENYDEVVGPSPVGKLVDKESLEAGTGFAIQPWGYFFELASKISDEVRKKDDETGTKTKKAV